MSNTNFFFRGQMEDEVIINFTRKHWIVLLPNIIPFCFYMTVIVLFVVNIKQFNLPSLDVGFFQLIVVLALIITTLTIHRFFLRMISNCMSITIFTNYRIVEIKKTVFIQDTKESLDLRKIQNIQLQQNGLIRNICKFGNLLVTIGNAETRTLYLIPNADYFFRLVNKLKNEQLVKSYNEMLNRTQQGLQQGGAQTQAMPPPEALFDSTNDDNFPYLIRSHIQHPESRDKKD